MESGDVIRLARRRPGRRFRLILRTAVALLVVAALIGVLFSPIFALRTVRVLDGPQSLGQGIGIALGTPIWRINLRAAQTVLLRRHPGLASAEIGRVWPNSVTLQVSYRRPVAVALAGGGTVYGVDRSGRVLTRRASPGGLPLLGGVAAESVRRWAQLSAPGLPQALSVAAQLEQLGFPFAEVVPGTTPTIYLDSGTQVRWPAASKAKSTLAALKSVLAALRRLGEVAATIDLRSPSRALVVQRR